MDGLTQILAAVVLAEAVTETIKTLIEPNRFSWQVAAAVVIGIVVALAFGLDLFAVAGLSAKVPFVGETLTGIVFGRGASYVHDLMGRLGAPRGAT